MSGDPNLVAGVAPAAVGYQDLMWGTDNERVRNKSDRRILKSTARILCGHVSHPGRMPPRNPSSDVSSTAGSEAST